MFAAFMDAKDMVDVDRMLVGDECEMTRAVGSGLSFEVVAVTGCLQSSEVLTGLDLSGYNPCIQSEWRIVWSGFKGRVGCGEGVCGNLEKVVVLVLSTLEGRH
jgi:hypothetical protein